MYKTISIKFVPDWFVTPSLIKHLDNANLHYAEIFNSLNDDLNFDLDDEFDDYLDRYLDLDDLAKLLNNRYKQNRL